MKLVIVSGPEQGRSFELGPGNNYIGRAEDNTVMLPSGQISRRHASVVLAEGRVFLEDLGSSNGTFLGGQRLSGKIELRPGMPFQMGEFTLEVTDGPGPALPRMRTVMNQPVAPPGQFPGGGMAPGPQGGQFPGGAMPQGQPPMPGLDPRATARPMAPPPHMMPMPVMPARDAGTPFWRVYDKVRFLGWRGHMILGALVVLVISLGLGVYPLVMVQRDALAGEALKRGEVLVRYLARTNGEFIKNRQDTNLDTTSILSEQGVSAAWLLSKDLTILSPVEQRGKPKVNEVSRTALIKSDLVSMEAPSVEENGETGAWHIAYPIRVWSNDRGIYEPFGVAYIVFQAEQVAEANGGSGARFGISAILVGLSLAAFVALAFAVTTRPMRALQEDAELALRGDLPATESRAKWRELIDLSHSLNRALERSKQAAAAPVAPMMEAPVPAYAAPVATIVAPQGGGGAPGQEDAKVEAIANAVPEGVIITDEMQRVVYLNRMAERVFNAPMSRAKGRHIMEVIPQPDILGAVLDLLRQIMQTEEKTVSTAVNVADGGGNRKVNIVVAGVKTGGNLEYAAIVLR